jgi:hypothetical protein
MGAGSRAEGRTAAPAYAVQWLAAFSHTNLSTMSYAQWLTRNEEPRSHDSVGHVQKNFDIGCGGEYLRSIQIGEES